MEDKEFKIFRCALPVFIYFFINMLVQVFVTLIVSAKEFIRLGEDGIGSYVETYNFNKYLEAVVSESGLYMQLITAVLTIAVCGILMKKDLDMKKQQPVREHLSCIEFSNIGYVAILGALCSIGLSKLVTILPIDNILGSYENVENAFEASALHIQVLVLVILGPVAEEIVFRGLVYNRIKGYTKEMTAVYLSSAIFGIYHFNLVQGLYAFMLGILLVYVYEKQRTILAPIIMHMSANLLALVMMYSDISKAIGDSLLIKIPVMLFEVGAIALCLKKMESAYSKMGKEE